MTGIINTLLEITVYSAVLFAAILIFQRLLRRRISAAMHLTVWALLILRLIVPVTVESGWHLFTVPQQTVQSEQAEAILGSDTVETPAISSAVQPISDKDMVSSQQQSKTESIAEQSATSISAKPLDWQTIIVIIWAAGAFVFLMYTSIRWLQLSRRLKRGSLQTPDYVRDMVKTERRSLRIRRDIRIAVQSWLVSPALSASLKPVLLLPASMMQETEALRFGIRHELTHYRRKDHLLSLLLLALRCVYWFNPVVWLAFRRMQADMEAACDAAVTNRMAETERTRYIHTMIDMGLSAKQPLYALGMGVSNGRKTLEKRVRGMFMTKRTGLTARMAAAGLALLMLFACFTTACQPTPEKPIVVNKNEGVLEAAVGATPAPAEKYKAPETFTMEPFTAGDKLTVNVDATVTIPDVDAFPVYEFIPAVYTQAQIDAVADYFYKGETLYNKNHKMTKSEIEQQIVELKKTKQEILDDATNKEGYPKYDMSADDVQADIDMLEKDIQDAPETSNVTVWDRKLLSGDNGDAVYKGFYVAPDLTEADTRYFTSGVYYNLNSSNLMLINGTRYYPSTNHPSDTQAKGIQTTPAQAVEIARDMLNTCGFDFMEPVGAYAGDVVESGEVVRNDLSSGYAVKCIRRVDDFYVTSAVNGVTVDMSRSNLTSEEMQAAYVHAWEPEVLTVYVDDTGITAVEWDSYGSIGATLSQNVALLPFNELGTYIKNGITSQYAWDNNWGEENKREIDISHIELSMARIQVKDHPEKWELVPAFEILGTVSTWHAGDNASAENNVQIQECSGYSSGFHSGSLLTINAVDGSAVKIY